jgi:hypothetical protein
MKKTMAVIVSTLVLASCKAGNGKNDILGIEPGLFRENLHKLAERNNWKCEPGGMFGNPAHEETCHTMAGVVTLFFAKNIEGEPIYRIGLDVKAGRNGAVAPVETMTREVSDQYGKNPDGNEPYIGPRWKLDNGNVLVVDALNYLTLINSGIADLDEQTAANNAPKLPKF